MHREITRRTFTRAGLATAAALPFAGRRAWAQAWPSRPIKIVCSVSAGGITDLLARAYRDYLSQRLGQPVVVENKPGAGGTVAAQAVKASPPDGYTLLFALTVTMVQNRVLYRHLPYDPDKDFVLISTMSGGSAVLMARGSTGATNMKEFVEYSRRNRVNVGDLGCWQCPADTVIAELNKQFGLQMEAMHAAGPVDVAEDFWMPGVLQAAQGGYYNTINSAQTGTGHVIAVRPRRTQKASRPCQRSPSRAQPRDCLVLAATSAWPGPARCRARASSASPP